MRVKIESFNYFCIGGGIIFDNTPATLFVIELSLAYRSLVITFYKKEATK